MGRKQAVVADAAPQAKQRLHDSFRRAREYEERAAREDLRDYRRRVWLARPFWFVCWCAAWWPVTVAIAQAGTAVAEGATLWNVALVGTGVLTQCLLIRVIYR